MYKVFEIRVMIFLNSASSERSFSFLRCLKTFTRQTNCQYRQTVIDILHIEKM